MNDGQQTNPPQTYHGAMSAQRSSKNANPPETAAPNTGDSAASELDDEELDLVSGGAQPSEQEPFAPGNYNPT